MGYKDNLILGDLSICRDWGWAPEYVEAMWLMLQQDEPDDYVISTGKSHTLEYFVKDAFLQFDLDWKKYVVFDSNLCRPSEIKYSCGDSTKANLKFGWKAINYLPDIIKLLIKDAKDNQIKQ